MSSLGVFDCFCGLGGLSLGADLAGLNVIGGVDGNSVAVSAYSKIFPNKIALRHNLLEDSPKRILRQASIARGDVDILVGGPPCQPYSVNNHQRGNEDARYGLVNSYLEFVSVLKPDWLVMENVPGFASLNDGYYLKALRKSLTSRGYYNEYIILNSLCFGVPQRRRRLVILANRQKSRLTNVVGQLREKASENVTVGEAIGDIPTKTSAISYYAKRPSCAFQSSMRTRSGKIISSHTSSELGQVNLDRIQHVPPGGNWRDIPKELLPLGMQRARLSDHTTRYGRLLEDQPSFTLLTKADPHWGCFVHPTQNRVISVREAARLQSIPDYVEFPSSLTASYKLIGNAVPPLLAKGIFELLTTA